MRVLGTFEELKQEVKEKLLNCEITADKITREDFKSFIFKDKSCKIIFQYGNKDYIIE